MNDSGAQPIETEEPPSSLPTAGLTERELSVPNAARMYDYFLGGHHNLAADREAAERVIGIYPDFPLLMQVGRAFLRRAVRYLVSLGVDRFLDVGSGIPTLGNVHQIAQQTNPAARVVYVDIDPVAVAHSAALLRDNPNTAVLQGDLRLPDMILRHPAVKELLATNKAVGLILAYVLHFVLDDDQALQVVRQLVHALPRGSYVVISHGSWEYLPQDATAQLLRLYQTTTQPVRIRTKAEIEKFFDGLELVEPGVVLAPLWHPDDRGDLMVDHPERSSAFAGVGLKP